MPSITPKASSRPRTMARSTSPPEQFDNWWIKRVWPYYARARSAPSEDRNGIVLEGAMKLELAPNTIHRQIASLLFLETIDYDASYAPRGLALLAIETIAKIWRADEAAGADLMKLAWERRITITKLLEIYKDRFPGAPQGGYQKETKARASLFRKVDRAKDLPMPPRAKKLAMPRRAGDRRSPPTDQSLAKISANRLLLELARSLPDQKAEVKLVLIQGTSPLDAPQDFQLSLISKDFRASAVAMAVNDDGDASVFAAEFTCAILQSDFVIGCYGRSTPYLRTVITRLYESDNLTFDAREVLVAGAELLAALSGRTFKTPADLLEAALDASVQAA